VLPGILVFALGPHDFRRPADRHAHVGTAPADQVGVASGVNNAVRPGGVTAGGSGFAAVAGLHGEA